MLDYAILGLLRHGPDYGYRLKTRMEACGASSWEINTGHVYYALKQLEKGGFVVRASQLRGEIDASNSRRRPDAFYYEITDAGLARLTRWLDGPPRTRRTTRFEIVARWMTFGDDRIEDAIIQLCRESRIHQRYYSKLLENCDAGSSEVRPPNLLAKLADQHAIVMAKAHADWIEDSLNSLRQMIADVDRIGEIRGSRDGTG